ncbi:hypothetical protein HanIR_Chr01g0039561 [Helianthus annuus]|nr:hypothetical protein HanIR_Chr01g0039561 [Helianthus annuus]
MVARLSNGSRRYGFPGECPSQTRKPMWARLRQHSLAGVAQQDSPIWGVR